MGFLGDAWSAITGSGGTNTQSGSQSGTTSGTSAQTTQQSQVQQQLQEIFSQQLASALQSLSGGGTTSGTAQYGLAPQDQFSQMGRQGLAGLMQGGNQPGVATGNLGGASNTITNLLPQLMQMLSNPSQSASAQDQIRGMTGVAQNFYDQNMKPQIDTNYTKSGMFGSTPWAAEQARGVGSLSANLGGQAAGILGNTANQGLSGLMSAPGGLSQMAGAEQAGDPFSRMIAGWNSLAQGGPQALQYGTTGAQQYGQTGSSSQAGMGSQSTLSNALASMLGLGTATNSGTSTGSFTGSQSTPGSLVGGLQNVTNLLGSGNQGKSTGMASFF